MQIYTQENTLTYKQAHTPTVAYRPAHSPILTKIFTHSQNTNIHSLRHALKFTHIQRYIYIDMHTDTFNPSHKQAEKFTQSHDYNHKYTCTSTQIYTLRGPQSHMHSNILKQETCLHLNSHTNMLTSTIKLKPSQKKIFSHVLTLTCSHFTHKNTLTD